jgi:hypothetical protein
VLRAGLDDRSNQLRIFCRCSGVDEFFSVMTSSQIVQSVR